MSVTWIKSNFPSNTQGDWSSVSLNNNSQALTCEFSPNGTVWFGTIINNEITWATTSFTVAGSLHIFWNGVSINDNGQCLACEDDLSGTVWYAQVSDVGSVNWIQTGFITGIPVNSWSCVSINSYGQCLACENNRTGTVWYGVVISGSVQWRKTQFSISPQTNDWSSVCVNDNAQCLACEGGSGTIWYGTIQVNVETDIINVVWAKTSFTGTPVNDWMSVSLNANGRAIACEGASNGTVWFGSVSESSIVWEKATFNLSGRTLVNNWFGTSINANDQVLACEDDGTIWYGTISVDGTTLSLSPVSFLQTPASDDWHSVTINDAGQALACEYAGTVWNTEYVSTLNPCVLDTTEILTFDKTINLVRYKQAGKINVGDYVISPISKIPVQVVKIVKKKIKYKTLDQTNRPIKIKKGFFSDNVPSKDVFISGHHRIINTLEDGSMIGIQAFKLCDNILSEEETKKEIRKKKIIYYNFELENRNEGMIASNLPIES